MLERGIFFKKRTSFQFYFYNFVEQNVQKEPKLMEYYDIMVVDDHPIVREGLISILSRQPGLRCSGSESVEQLLRSIALGNHYQLFILDVEFPMADIYTVVEKIKAMSPDSSILIYTVHEEPWILARLVELPVDGFVSKSSSIDELINAVLAIRAGKTAFNDNFLNAKGISQRNDDDGGVVLTDREKQVLAYITQGLKTSEIAAKLHISYYTVKTHRSHLLKKLHAKNVVEIVTKGKKYL